MTNKKILLTTVAASVSMAAFTSSASAQLDTIVVTAEKKEENLQDVPIAINAFDEAALDNYRIEGLLDIAEYSPGVYVTQNPADPNGVRVNIRGVGTFDPQLGQDSRIAIYQDGVYLGRTQGLAFDLPDLARVEVLKGPQGTLYGRNTVGGAINLISQAPTGGELSGSIDGEYGNFDYKRIRGAINFPLAETVGLRLSGLWQEQDGWVENSGPGTDFAGGEKYAFRAALGVDANPNARIDVAFDYNRSKAEPLFYQSITDFGAGLFAPAITTFDGRQDEVTTSFAPERGDLETWGASIVGKFDLRETDEIKVTIAYREAESRRFVTLVPTANPLILNSFTNGFNQALAPLPTAFLVGGQGLSSTRADWLDQFGPGREPDEGLFLSAPGGATTLDGHEQLSVEATYNGVAFDDRLEFTVGAFYYDESTGTGNEPTNPRQANDYLFVLGAFSPAVPFPNGVGPGPYTTPGLQGVLDSLGPIPQAGVLLATAFGAPAGMGAPVPTLADQGQAAMDLTTLIGFPGNPSPLAGATVYSQLANARQSAANTLFIDTQAFAFYGQATLNITDALRLTAGLRYSNEQKDGIGQPKSAFFGDNINLVGEVIEPNIGEIDFDVIDPSAILEYDVNDDVLLYASYKQSFRSGGFNSAAVGTRVPGTTAGPDFLFGREDISAYEIGFKGDFNDQFRLNVAGFYYDFKDQQTTVALNPLIATSRAVVNTDEEIWGVEVDGLVAVNENITLRGQYSWIDGDAGDVTNPLTMVTEVRDEIQGTPKHSFLIGADLNAPISNSAEFFGTVNYSYKDDILSIPQNALRLDSRNLLSARVGVNFDVADGKNAFVAVWGENLLDDEYLIDSLPFETFAYRTVVYGQPRSYGVSVGLDF